MTKEFLPAFTIAIFVTWSQVFSDVLLYVKMHRAIPGTIQLLFLLASPYIIIPSVMLFRYLWNKKQKTSGNTRG